MARRRTRGLPVTPAIGARNLAQLQDIVSHIPLGTHLYFLNNELVQAFSSGA